MPVTPFHFGPGALVKVTLRKSFSFKVFVLTQILIDSEVVWNFFRGNERLHTSLHSYFGSSMAILVIFILLYLLRFRIKIKDLRVWFLSTIVGAWSHVLLDSMMHPDIQPLYPFSSSNLLFQTLSLSSLHLGCILSGVVGGLAWMWKKL